MKHTRRGFFAGLTALAAAPSAVIKTLAARTQRTVTLKMLCTVGWSKTGGSYAVYRNHTYRDGRLLHVGPELRERVPRVAIEIVSQGWRTRGGA